jgi:hypothetical protein
MPGTELASGLGVRLACCRFVLAARPTAAAVESGSKLPHSKAKLSCSTLLYAPCASWFLFGGGQLNKPSAVAFSHKADLGCWLKAVDEN